MLQGVSFSEIFGFQIEWPFREFVQICFLVNVVLQNLALPMDWISGLKGLVVQSAHRWPGVGLVLGCLQCVVSKPTQRETHKAWHWTLGANASWFLGCMTARRCAKVLAGGSQYSWLACWRGGLSLLETAHVWIDRMSFCIVKGIRCCRGGFFWDFWFSDRMTFPWVCADLFLGKCGLAKSRSTLDWKSGLKGLVVQSAHRWPGVGLVLGCLHSVPAGHTRHGIGPLGPTHPDFRMYDSETMR